MEISLWLPLGLGLLAFALLFCSDFCTLRKRPRLSGLCFTGGVLLLAGATVWILAGSDLPARPGGLLPLRLLALAIALGFLALLLYTLFFALPFQATYQKQEQLALVDHGVYALCRHPGVLWLAGVYLFLWLFCGRIEMGLAGLLFSGMNVCYVWWQDCRVFPQTIAGYLAYRETVPFLIPNKGSIAKAKEGK